MSYRKDPDLEILSLADNEDLLMLADALEYSTSRDKERNSPRWAATLYMSEGYKRCYPDHLHGIWQEVGEELQKYGGNTMANMLRGNGVLYREILLDVCSQFNVRGFHYSKSSIGEIENLLLEKLVEKAIEKMSDTDRRAFFCGLKGSPDFSQWIKNRTFSKDAMISIVKKIYKMGGFQSYILTLQLVNGICRTVMGRGLTLAANAFLTQSISRYLAWTTGPIGLAFTAVTTLWSMMGPNKDVRLRSVVIVAYMRKKRSLEMLSGN